MTTSPNPQDTAVPQWNTEKKNKQISETSLYDRKKHAQSPPHLHAVLELRPVAVHLEHGHFGFLEGAVALGPEARGVLEPRPEREVVEGRVHFVVLLVCRVCIFFVSGEGWGLGACRQYCCLCCRSRNGTVVVVVVVVSFFRGSLNNSFCFAKNDA